MSIASMVAGVNLMNANNPNTNIFQATPAPSVPDWTQNAKQLNTFSAPGWNDWSFKKYAAPDPTFQKYGQQAPQYKGLVDGDYNRLEESLRSPGEVAAKQAYENARKTLAAGATNRGMYGSSNYTNQMVGQAAQPYMDTLASNAARAASGRYGMQQQDLQFGQGQQMTEWLNRLAENTTGNQFGYNVWNSRLNENNLMNQLDASQNIAKNNFGMQGALASFGAGNDAIKYGNQLLAGGYENAWRPTQWESTEKNRLANLLFNFAGANDQLTDSLKAKQISNYGQGGGDSMNGLAGGLGSLGGSLMSSMGSMGGGGMGGMFGGGGGGLGSTAGMESFYDMPAVGGW